MRITDHFSTFLLLLVLPLGVFAQVPKAREATARVAGRVTVEGKPARGVQVLLNREDARRGANTQSRAVSATTNAEGRYEITNVAANAYRLSVYAPAYVIDGQSPFSYDFGKTVNVAEGDQLENLDFSLMKGAVITGKVTDEYGRPVIAQGVAAFRLDEQGKSDQAAAGEMLRWQTDDRGVYRIFGIEPGRYIVGVGASGDESLPPLANRGLYKRIYYPDAVDQSSARIIELKPGEEVGNVDIKLAPVKKTYTASGRVIDSETGKPLPGVMIGCDVAKAAGASFRTDDNATNSKGEFSIEGLSPNTYLAYVYNPGQSDLYSDRLNFEIADDDVTGLEIKMVRGASISGVAVVEGTRNPAVLARLSQIAVRAERTSQDTAMLMMLLMQGGGTGTISPNGTLRIGGVRPGRTRIVAMPPPELKGFTLARVERNGVDMNELDVAQGEQITGMRLVFTYGTSILAGRVEIKGGALPSDAQMTVRIVREGASSTEWWHAKQAPVDARGQFTIEGVSEGNYKAHLMIFTNDDSQFPKIEQSVSIPADVRREITLVLDLTKQGASQNPGP